MSRRSRAASQNGAETSSAVGSGLARTSLKGELLLQPEVARDIHMDFAHLEAPATVLLDLLILVAAGERGDHPILLRFAHQNDIALRVGLAAIDADEMIHRAMLARGSLAGARHVRRDKLLDRPAALQPPELPGLENAIDGEQLGEFFELAVIDVEAVFRHQIADCVFFFQCRRHSNLLIARETGVFQFITRSSRYRPGRSRR